MKLSEDVERPALRCLASSKGHLEATAEEHRPRLGDIPSPGQGCASGGSCHSGHPRRHRLCLSGPCCKHRDSCLVH